MQGLLLGLLLDFVFDDVDKDELVDVELLDEEANNLESHTKSNK